MKSALAEKPATATVSDKTRFEDLVSLVQGITQNMRMSCLGALRVGLRLAALHQETNLLDSPGGFRAALTKLEGCEVPPSTAYRWMNAAVGVMVRDQGVEDEPSLVMLPEWNPTSEDWKEADQKLTNAANGMSLRRLLVGSAATGDESRQETLITAAEGGDPHAIKMLEAVAAGKLTLVQAIRAAAGAAATKDKTRHDPIYLDIDGITGQPTGLFPKCLVTLSNTFARWETLDESARVEAKKSWKALVANLPRELR
jgi:hypothetical protein